MGSHRRPTVVLCGDEVVDDDTLHPGTVVWLGEPALRPDELERYGRSRVTDPTRASARVRSWRSGPVAP